MKTIIIDETIYRVTERQYAVIRQKYDDIRNPEYSFNKELDLYDFLHANRIHYKKIGVVNFSFRL